MVSMEGTTGCDKMVEISPKKMIETTKIFGILKLKMCQKCCLVKSVLK